MEIYRECVPACGRNGRREAERVAVKRIIGRVFGSATELAHRDDGSPYLPSRPDLHISISHCADECVVAVSDQPVGVDVETPREQLSRIAAKFLTEAELSRGPHDIATLLKYWTAKEAVFKCASEPLLVISEVEVSEDMTSALARGHCYTLAFTLAMNRVIAIARHADVNG